jgi:HK97 family phage major capsid protein
MTFTKKHLYDLAVSEVGFKGSPDDWEAAKKALLSATNADGEPEPIEEVKVGSEVINIKELVFQKTEKPRGRRVAFMVDPNDDMDDKEEKFQAAVKDAVEKAIGANGRPRGNGRVQPISDTVQVGTVKSGEERMYEHRIARKTSVFQSYDMALSFGRDIQVKALRALQQGEKAQELYTKTAEYLTQKGYTLTTTASGGALAAEGYDADLWQLLLQYGVARKVARVANMPGESLTRPKASGDLTVYYPNDGGAGTESTKTFSNVQMRAKEGMVITKASRALLQDSAINVADDAGRDIVRAVAKVEDNSLFNSDGSGVANGYIPGTQGILNIISETSTGARVFKSSATTPGAVTLGDVQTCMSTPGRFVGRMMAWHCTGQISGVLFHRLAASAGGITAKEIVGLGEVDHFLNVPIIYNNVMTTNLSTGSNRQLAIYGDISLAADFGDRMGLSVEISEQRYWDENNIGIKGTVRHDINVHGLGASTTTGPLAVLIQS